MNLRGSVVVVTGASSGLGRAAAIEFSRRGAEVYVAARREESLEDTAARCAAVGRRAHVVVTDVTVEADVQRLAHTALQGGGRIDVWVNNAGVTVFGRIEEIPAEEHRRVLDTNVLGAIHGARAVMPIFRRERRGVLINVGSILSKVGQPYVPSYVVSKFAIRGLTETLRTDVADLPHVHVCTLLPFSIDTPHFQSGASHAGRPALALPPMQSPEEVARILVDLAEHPVRERHVPRFVQLGLALHALLPKTVEDLIQRVLTRWHFAPSFQEPTQGNLYLPPEERGRTHGDRPPRISGRRLILWVGKQLALMPIQAVTRRADT